MAAVVEAFFPSHTQGVVDALIFDAFGGAVSFTIDRRQCHHCTVVLIQIILSPPW